MSRLRGRFGGTLARQLGQLYENGSAVGLGEAELLERYLFDRDESAFEALIERHGPMVRRVCRRLLNDPNDVEDAVQATFLVLVRKAGMVRRPELLGNWLYGVACRVSARARSNAIARRNRLEPIVDGKPEAAATSAMTQVNGESVIDDQWIVWLHEEIQRLPLKYQTPIILCYFEGLTHESAGRRLSWPIGTIKGRLARARELLRKRLARKGVALSAAMIEMGLGTTEAGASVTVPLASLVSATGISASVIHLARGVSNAMILTQIKAAVLPVLVTGAVASGMVWGAGQGQGDKAADRGALVAQAKSVDPASGKVPETKSVAAKEKPSAAERPMQESLSNAEVQAVLQVFAIMASTSTKFEPADYQRLIGWSQQILDENLKRSHRPVDRELSLEAHRDRLKMLTDRLMRTGEDDGVVSVNSQKDLPQGQSGRVGVLMQATAAAKADVEQRLNAHLTETAPQRPITKASPESVTKTKSASTKKYSKIAAKNAAAKSKILAETDQPVSSTQSAQGGVRGMRQFEGGGFGAPSEEDQRQAMFAMRRRVAIAGKAAALAVHQKDPKSLQVFDVLEQPLEMAFANKTPLADILRYVEEATSHGPSGPIPIFIDAKGLESADATLKSAVAVDLKGIPLRTSLRLILKQLGLAYCVRDGVLIISDVDGISAELEEARTEITDREQEEESKRNGFGGPIGGMGQTGGMM